MSSQRPLETIRLDTLQTYYARGVRSLDQDVLKGVLAAYRDVEQAILDQYAQLDQAVRTLREQGQEPSPAVLFQLEEYRALLDTVRSEMRRYTEAVHQLLQTSMTQATELAVDHAEAAGIQLDFSTLHPEAFGAMAGSFIEQWGASPLVDLLRRRAQQALDDELVDAAVDQARRALLTGMAAGWHPRTTAKLLREALATTAYRAQLIARTETIRAYRNATFAIYQSTDAVKGWRWVAAKSTRTCAMCRALDGMEFSKHDVIQDHPNGRCTIVPILEERPRRESETKRQQRLLKEELARLIDDGTPESYQRTFSELPFEEQARLVGKKRAAWMLARTATLRDLITFRVRWPWGVQPRWQSWAEIVANNLDADDDVKRVLESLAKPNERRLRELFYRAFSALLGRGYDARRPPRGLGFTGRVDIVADKEILGAFFMNNGRIVLSTELFEWPDGEVLSTSIHELLHAGSPMDVRSYNRLMPWEEGVNQAMTEVLLPRIGRDLGIDVTGAHRSYRYWTDRLRWLYDDVISKTGMSWEEFLFELRVTPLDKRPEKARQLVQKALSKIDDEDERWYLRRKANEYLREME